MNFPTASVTVEPTTALAPSASAEVVATGFSPHVYPSPESHPALVYLAKLAPGSRLAMQGALDVIADAATGGACDRVSMPWHLLRYEHTEAIRAQLSERYNHRTVNKQLSALRQVLKRCWRLGYMDAESYHRAADIENVSGDTPSQVESGRALTMGEFMALVGACNDGTAAGIRDAAILGVGYACGLRRAEIAALDVEDFDAQAGTLRIQGKRNKVRSVPISNGAKDALEDWLAVRGNHDGPVFVRVHKGGRLTDSRLTTQAIYVILQHRAELAEVAEFTPHDLRRSYAGDLLDAGADISTVQKLMGHSNVSTTAGYDRRDSRAKHEAAKKLHFPYKRRGA